MPRKSSASPLLILAAIEASQNNLKSEPSLFRVVVGIGAGSVLRKLCSSSLSRYLSQRYGMINKSQLPLQVSLPFLLAFAFNIL